MVAVEALYTIFLSPLPPPHLWPPRCAGKEKKRLLPSSLLVGSLSPFLARLRRSKSGCVLVDKIEFVSDFSTFDFLLV